MKLRYFALFLPLCVFILFTSCSYAYTWDDFYNQCLQAYNDSSSSTNIKDTANKFLSRYNDLNTYISNHNLNISNCSSFIIAPDNGIPSSSGYLVACYSSVNYSLGLNNRAITVSGTPTVLIRISSRGTISSITGVSTIYGAGNDGYIVGLLNNQPTYGTLNTNKQKYYLQNVFIPPYTGPVFTPSNNGTIEVIASIGVSENMTRLPFSYSGQSDWTLGFLSDYNDVYSIFGYFGPLFYLEGQLYTEGYENEFSYNKYLGTNNGGLIFDASTGRVSIKKEKLVNKQGYSLLLEYRLNNGDTLEDIGEYNYYAYFFNLNISSGDLVSPDINSTVDITMLNALDEFFSYSSGDSDNTNYDINELLNFSGDLFSGDLFSGEIFNRIGYNNHYSDNDYSLTLYDFYRRIIGVLLDDSTTSYIEFEYRGNTYRFYASDFHTPDGPLKVFISGFIIVLFSIGIVKFMAVLFKRMAILDFVGIASSFDVDDSNFL